MPRSIAIGTLVTRCQKRANRDGDLGQVDPTEYKQLISEKYGELHALVVEKGARYFEIEATIDLNNLALPADHLTTIGIDFVLSGTTGPRRPLYGPIPPQVRTYYVGLPAGGPAFVWDIEGSNLAMYPAPTSGTYKHIYAPQPTDLSAAADSTTVDLINIYGEKFILWGVAAIVLHRGSEDQARALAEEQKARDEAEYWACQRALTQPSYRVPEDIIAPYWDGVDFWVPPR